MQIHLCKPGGQQEGPYTLEQIKQDLAANKYSDNDYWAWHEGIPKWVPLYLIPGLSAEDTAAAPESKQDQAPVRGKATSLATTEPALAVAPAPARPEQPPTTAPGSAAPAAPIAAGSGPVEIAPMVDLPGAAPHPAAAGPAAPPAAPVPEPEAEPVAARAPVASGMPAGALEQVFMFTTGDGPSAWQSPTVARMLQEIVGEELGARREDVERDVVAWCAMSELLKPDGSISDSVWRAMAAHRPMLIQQAREKLYRVCVRTFRIEADMIVALVLFYNKQKF